MTARMPVMSTRGVVAAGHYLAASAGLRVLQQGGNAIDAAAATCFCLNLLEPHQNGIGGEVPTLIYSARERKAYALSGMGWSPKSFTIDWCRENGIDLIPGDGYLPACVPSVVDSWAVALARFGTISLGQAMAPAIELADQGWPMQADLSALIETHEQRFRERYPHTAAIYLPGGRLPRTGDVFRNPDFAETLRTICRAEEDARHKGRIAALEAARDAFYRGPLAERIASFVRDNPVEDASGTAHAGLLSYDDMAQWRAQIEEPVTLEYRGLDVHKCSSWTQGPVFVQQLALLKGFDLAAMDDVERIHTITECAKLAFADREAYYGDPLIDDVPFDVLLSEEYNARRRELVGPEASVELRPGDAGRGAPDYASLDVKHDNRDALGFDHDTTHLEVIDREGNMVSSTPSGGWIQTSPVIEGLGFCLGTRGQMFYLDPRRPNALAPHKRPRATLTPTLVTRKGEPYLTLGTPGGDGQDQWTLQCLVNYVDLGMDLQAALDAPHYDSAHFPSSFYPRAAQPGRITLDNRLPDKVVNALRDRGHKIARGGYEGLKMMAIRIDRERGTIVGGVASAPTTAQAVGW